MKPLAKFKSLALFLCGLFLLILLIGCSHTPDAYDTQGNAISFKNYRGKWIVINYWAEWCKPCWQEIPELNAFYLAHKNSDAIVFGVNYDQLDSDKLTQLTQQMLIKFPVLTSDPGKLWGIDNVSGLPSTFIINPQGKLVKTLVGPQTQKTLNQAIGQSS